MSNSIVPILRTININILKYIIIILILTLNACNKKNIQYDKRIKKFLDNNKIEYKIDSENDFIALKNINNEKTEVIIRSKLNSYKNSKIREIFGIVEIFDINSQKIKEISEPLMIDSHNNRILGSWEIIHNTERGTNFLIYVIKVEEFANETFLLDAIEEISSTIITFKKIIKNTENIHHKETNNNDNIYQYNQIQPLEKGNTYKQKKNDPSEEDLQKIKAQ